MAALSKTTVALLLLALIGSSSSAVSHRRQLRNHLSAPAPAPYPLTCQTVASLAISNPDLSILLGAIKLIDLTAVVADPGFMATIFAPSNDAFEKFWATTNSKLNFTEVDIVKPIIEYHIVPGPALMAADLSDGLELTTLSGLNLTISIDEEETGAVQIIAGASVANVTTADLVACEAVIHIIDYPLVPVVAAASA